MKQSKGTPARDPKSIADDLSSWLESAVGDIAYDQHSMYSEGMLFDTEAKKFKQAVRDGVTDLPGWYADELYNNKDTISDLMGDRIHDEGKGDPETMIQIAECIKDRGHTALVQAMNELIIRWRERKAKQNG